MNSPPAVVIWSAAVLIAAFFGLLLFAFHQYQTSERRWGVKLVLGLVGGAVVVGVGVSFDALLGVLYGVLYAVGFMFTCLAWVLTRRWRWWPRALARHSRVVSFAFLLLALALLWPLLTPLWRLVAWTSTDALITNIEVPDNRPPNELQNGIEPAILLTLSFMDVTGRPQQGRCSYTWRQGVSKGGRIEVLYPRWYPAAVQVAEEAASGSLLLLGLGLALFVAFPVLGAAYTLWRGPAAGAGETAQQEGHGMPPLAPRE